MRTERGWGYVRQRGTAAAPRFQASYMHNGRRVYAALLFSDRRKAHRWLREQRSALEQGLLTSPGAPAPLLGDFWRDEYSQRHLPDLAPRTQDLYSRLWANHLAPRWQHYRLDELTSAEVERWLRGVRDAADGRGGRTAGAHCWRLLRSMLNQAVEWGLLARNTVKVGAAGKEPKRIPRALYTVEQWLQLADAVDLRWHAWVMLAGLLGPRVSETTALRRMDVDLRGGVVHLRRQVQYLPGASEGIEGPLKNGEARSLTMPEPLVRVMAEHLAEFVGPEPEALLWPVVKGLRKGQPVKPAVVAVMLRRAAQDAGLPHIHPHALRAFALTQASLAGVGVADLQQLGGHRSFEAAMRYQHATTAGQRAIADFRTEQMRQARQVVDLEQVRRSREGGPEALAQ